MPDRRRPPGERHPFTRRRSQAARRPTTSARSENEELSALVTSLPDVEDPPALTLMLTEYLSELRQWNVQGNLVSQSDLGRLVSRHVTESFAALPWLDRSLASQVIDVGSGGGFPIIPLKLARPRIQVALVESRRMKSLFLRRVSARLELQSFWVWNMRIESLADLPQVTTDPTLEQVAESVQEDIPTVRPTVDLVTARAVAPLSDLARWSERLVGPGGRLLAFKGSRLEEELEAWKKEPGAWRLDEVAPVSPEIKIVVLQRE